MDQAEDIYKERQLPFGSLHIDAPMALNTELTLLSDARFSSISVERRWNKSALVFNNNLANRAYVEPHPKNKKAWNLYNKLGFISKARPEFLEKWDTYLEIIKDIWSKSFFRNKTDLIVRNGNL